MVRLGDTKELASQLDCENGQAGIMTVLEDIKDELEDLNNTIAEGFKNIVDEMVKTNG